MIDHDPGPGGEINVDCYCPCYCHDASACTCKGMAAGHHYFTTEFAEAVLSDLRGYT